LVQLLTHTASTSIRRISPSRAVQKALYRFLNNSKVDENTLIDELCIRSCSLCAERHVLCIQDTTEMNFFSQAQRIKDNSGLGRLDGHKPSLGFKMHSTLMLDAENGDMLGFSDVKLWHRPLDMPNRRERNYQSLPIEQKESYKWIEAAVKSKERLTAARSITFIEDREGDIYEQLSSIADSGVHYIVRSKANRNTTEGNKIWDLLEQKRAVGEYIIELPTDHRKNRKKAKVTLNVRYAQAAITKGSHKGNGSYPASFPLTIVEAYEPGKNGISWILLTTHDVTNFEEAYQIIEWYAQRWTIEQVHRVLKSKGFQIEDSELESGWAIRKLCILMLSALLRIFQMNMAYSEPEGGQPIEEVFSEKEVHCLKLLNDKLQGATQKLKNNNDQSKLKWATWIIARLGGWTGYDSQGPPGVIILKRGLDKFSNIFYGWSLAEDVGTR
jgi:hypothetical protein